MKKCSRCKQILPKDSFHKNGKWLGAKCKPCLRAIKTSPEGRERERAWDRNYRKGEIYRANLSRPETVEARRASRRKYYQTARGQVKRREYRDRRREQINRATPPWADHAAITAFYIEARRLTRETGIKHDVDHIVPLLDYKDFCCGLHVENNLRILTEKEHRAEKKYSDFCLETLWDVYA